MKAKSYAATRYIPFGDSGLLVEFGDSIDLETNRKVTALAGAITKATMHGVEELVPTYRSLLIRYDPMETSYEALVFHVRDVERILRDTGSEAKGRRLVVPVVYGGEYGPDLSYVARSHKLSDCQVVQMHSATDYRVYMIGFVAGFPYLGEVSDKIATPRFETPRLKVPAGSVGIAEKQTGIYPREAPGGWRIIGRTPLRLFNPFEQPPTPLKAGDTVKFKPISEKEFRTTTQNEPSMTTVEKVRFA